MKKKHKGVMHEEGHEHRGATHDHQGKQFRGHAMHMHSHKEGDAMVSEEFHKANKEHDMDDGFMPPEEYQGHAGQDGGAPGMDANETCC
jgi:hypothetical protein